MNKTKEFFDNLADKWDSLENKTYEAKYNLLSKLGIEKGNEVLDLACGTGVITSIIHEYSSSVVTGIDLSDKMIAIAKEKYKDTSWAHFTATDLFDYDGKKFDYIIAYNCYPHFMDPLAFSKKLSELLNDNGRFSVVHSMSMKDLNEHHKNVPKEISREIKDIDEEISYFANEFDIIKTESTDEYFYFTGRKK